MVVEHRRGLPHDGVLGMSALSCGCEGVADLEKSVPIGIVQFHFTDVFTLEDMHLRRPFWEGC